MRARLCLLALVVVAVPALLWAVLPVGSTAQSPASIQNKINHKEAQIGAKRQHEQVLTSDISAFTHRIVGLQSSIDRLAARQAKLQSSLDAERAQLAAVQQKLRAERLRLARLRAKLLEARQVLARRLVQIYETGEPDLVSVVLDANGFADLLERTEFMQRISHQDTQIIDTVVTARAEATASAKRLGGLEKKETAVTAQIESRRNQVADVKVGLQGTQNKLAGYRAGKQRLLASTQSSRHNLEDDVASLRSEQRKIEARLASTSGPAVAGPIRQGSGGLIWPVNGPITSPFCERRAWEACHPGIDIGVPSGTPIRAAAAGTVVLMQTTGTSGGYGNFTCIQHTGVMSTCYAHQERFAVTMGQHVAQGQVIGYSDCTGLCFGPHLHFEVRINGQVTNPMNYL